METRTVTANGSLTKATTTMTTATLSSADLDTLLANLNMDAFATGMRDGFKCPPPPTDIWYSFVWKTSAGEQTQSITGCVVSSEPSLAKATYDLMKKY